MAAEDQIEYIARCGSKWGGHWGRGATIQEALEGCCAGPRQCILQINRVDGDWQISDFDGALSAENQEPVGDINLPKLFPLPELFEMLNRIMEDSELVDKIIEFGDPDYYKYRHKTGQSKFDAVMQGMYELSYAHDYPEGYDKGEEGRDLYRKLVADVWGLSDAGLEKVLGPVKALEKV